MHASRPTAATIGEVMLRGNTIMKGYLKNPAATDDAFADGWFHTGDLAVWHPDGYIEIKDRSKDIIISGGENVRSLEVEECCTVTRTSWRRRSSRGPTTNWGETPCAFVTLKPDAGDPSADIIAWCRAAWRISRRRRRSYSGRCRRPRPAKSRNTRCATAPRI